MKPSPFRRYLPIIRWSDQDHAFVGACPPIVGDCCHGADPAAVMLRLEVIVAEHLALMRADRVPLPAATNRPYSGTVSLRLGADLHRAVAVRSLRDGRSINDTIRAAVQHQLAEA
ncbi:MAG: hypothetical protein RLZZ127_2425 [Planctomycetota bacterium]|jgi:predicted HicB family RNase H-like nuclease